MRRNIDFDHAGGGTYGSGGNLTDIRGGGWNSFTRDTSGTGW